MTTITCHIETMSGGMKSPKEISKDLNCSMKFSPKIEKFSSRFKMTEGGISEHWNR